MDKIKGKFVEEVILADGTKKTNIVEKEINIEDIILYSLTKNGKDIRLLVRNTSSSERVGFEDTLVGSVAYNEETMNSIIKGMSQIYGMFTTTDDKMKVRYEDGSYIICNPNLKLLVTDILSAQSKLKPAKPSYGLGEFENTNSDERRRKINKRRIKWIAAAVTATILGLTALGCSLKKEKPAEDDKTQTESGPKATATPIPDKSATPAPEATPIYVAKKSDRTYSFDPNDLDTLNKKGLEFYNRVMGCSDLSILTSGEILTFDESLATEMVSLANGVYPEGMKLMVQDAAKEELDRILLAFDLYAFARTKEEANIPDFADFVADSQDSELIRKTGEVALEAITKSIGEPLNGDIIDSEDQTGVFSEEYLGAIDKLLNCEIDTKYQAEYNQANDIVRYIVMTQFDEVNAAVVLPWSYVNRTSNTEVRKDDERFIWYLDEQTKQNWIAIQGPNKITVLYQPCDPYTCEPVGEPLTQEQMDALADSNSNGDPNDNDDSIYRMGIDSEIKAEMYNAKSALIERVKDNSVTVTK
jgi:hypothetical protein